MYTCSLRNQIAALAPYVPGLSIDEIRQKYGLTNVIKMASNENPLGTSPFVQEAIKRHANEVFRYPRGGNPRLIAALAKLHGVPKENLIVGNGSDEIIDLLIRILADPQKHSIACFAPCFNLYPIQAEIAGVAVQRCPLKKDFSFDFTGLTSCVNISTRLVFLTTPDNPSGYCPSSDEIIAFAHRISEISPECLLLIDEAYMDFCPNSQKTSLLEQHTIPENVAIMRTFSKSYGLAGLRLGYAFVPKKLADAFWRTRLPFSVNILAEEAGLAALEDTAFRKQTLETVANERSRTFSALEEMGCHVYPSSANFLLFKLPKETLKAEDCCTYLLKRGIIIRLLKSYSLPNHLRVSIGNHEDTTAFLCAMHDFLQHAL